MKKEQIIAFGLLVLVLSDVSSVFWDEFYRRRDDEPVKNQIFNFQANASISSSATVTISPSPSIEIT